MKTKGLLNIGLLLGLALDLSAPVYAQYQSTPCQLTETCNLKHLDNIYIPITAADGTKYQCALKAEKEGDSILVRTDDEKDFSFDSKTDSVDHAGKTIIIEGKFTRPEIPSDEGQIKFTNLSSTADGQVSCSKLP